MNNKAERPAKITWKNIKAVFQAKKRQLGSFSLPQYIYEQIIWRRTEVMKNSPMCWYSGNCKICGCEIIGKTMEDRGCSLYDHPDLMVKRKPCYPEMMEEKKWGEYKKLHNIKLFE